MEKHNYSIDREIGINSSKIEDIFDIKSVINEKQLEKPINSQCFMNINERQITNSPINMRDESLINILYFKRGQKENIKIIEGEIIAIMEGGIRISTLYNKINTIEKNTLIFFPPNINCRLSFTKNTTLIVLKINDHINLCKQLIVEEFLNLAEDEDNEISFLIIKKQLKTYINTINAYFEDGINHYYLSELKLREFFILLEGYYTKKELASFFQPLLSVNAQFTYFILKNYQEIKTVKEFAEKANLSLSSFEKEFKKVFNISPYRWMKQKKMKYLLHQISNSTKPFKVISEECGFSSTSQMNDFCKKEWRMTPGEIRNHYVKKEIRIEDCE